MTFKDQLVKMNACSEAIHWVQNRTLEDSWNECERGDWLLWFARRVRVDSKIRTLAKVKCARLVEHLMKDQRSIKALNVAERFGRGEATKEELDAAYYDAHAAYSAAKKAAAHAAAHAAHAAAHAAHADCAYAVTYAAADAAADAADAAADAAAYADVRNQALAKCADLVRDTIDINLIKYK